MLARVTYGLVALALATLVAGFFVEGSNTLLYVSIGLSLAAIVLVLVGAARRAREAPAEEFAPGAFEEAEEEEEVPEDVLAAFDEFEDEEELLDEDEEWEEEPEEEWEEEEWEEEEEEEPEPAPRRRRAAAASSRSKTSTTRKAPAKSKAKAPAKSKASSKKKAASRTSNKVLVVPGRDRFHGSDCRFVRDKDTDELEEITKATAKRRGYEPCSVCSPD